MLSNCGVGEDPWESLGLQEIKPVNPKRNQPWTIIGRTDAEAETPVLWSPDAKSLLTGKDPDGGKNRRQEKKEVTEDELFGWYHWLNGYEFVQSLGDAEEQGSLVCCSPWCCKELDMTERLNKKNWIYKRNPVTAGKVSDDTRGWSRKTKKRSTWATEVW